MDAADKRQYPPNVWSLADGALDTLGCIFNTMGSESFPLDTDGDPYGSSELGMEAVQHIENGAAARRLEMSKLTMVDATVSGSAVRLNLHRSINRFFE